MPIKYICSVWLVRYGNARLQALFETVATRLKVKLDFFACYRLDAAASL
jgi:hypothetical protein